MKTFEQYLAEVFAKDYMGSDDDMTDKFDDWVCQLDNQEIIDLANEYGKKNK